MEIGSGDCQSWQGGANPLIETAGSLTATGDEEHRFVRVKTQARLGQPGVAVVAQLGDVVADRRAGTGYAGASEAGRRLFESGEGLAGPRGHQSVGPSGDGVGFMEEGRCTQLTPREHRRCGREASHPQDGVGRSLGNRAIGELPSGRLPGAGKSQEESPVVATLQTHRRKCRRLDAGQSPDSRLIHFLRRDQQRDSGPASPQFPAHGQARKQVSSGSAAGDGDMGAGARVGVHWAGRDSRSEVSNGLLPLRRGS